MAQKKYLPHCPHCGRRLDFWEAWLIHAQGEYDCPRCFNPSNIIYHRNLRRLAGLTILIGVLFFIGSMLLSKGEHIWGIFPVMLPFVLFALFSSRYMKLESFGARRTPKIAPGYLEGHSVPPARWPVQGGPDRSDAKPARRPANGGAYARNPQTQRQPNPRPGARGGAAPLQHRVTERPPAGGRGTNGVVPPGQARGVRPAHPVRPPSGPRPHSSSRSGEEVDNILREFIDRPPQP